MLALPHEADATTEEKENQIKKAKAMTPYSTTVTVLLIAAIVLIVKLIIKVINLHDENTRAEQDADRYAKELANVKTELEKAKAKYRSLANDYNLLDSFKTRPKNGDVGTFHIVKDFAKSDVNVVKHFDSIRNWFVIKSFHYGDAEEECHARLEAEDLLDALNGKVGWRKSIG